MSELNQHVPEDLVTEAQIQAKGLTAGPRITPEQVDAWLERCEIIATNIPGKTTTLALAFLDGNYYLGSTFSACVSPENFDEELGIQIATKKMLAMLREKAWEMLGYELYCQKQAGQVTEAA